MASTISRQPSETLAFAREIASRLRPGAIIALNGDLGSGKTQFVKGLALGLGFAGEVTSPTFTLIHEYVGGRVPLYHFDFYRLNTEEEALELGLEEYLRGSGVCVIEWAGKFRPLIPADARWFDLSIGSDDTRLIDQRL
ncbi:MAG TPA: tRNA (adenosine(37)-N6)-threonylcarbamoyltransferase complex ATPase subunit type 1 TsaE [Chthoniobacteraceae bacterium]|nr:tRNA (adenosine(37)-N6)-threonylcarbamoyltransferase complex ATPase subunit type 1 TsaE [Chthoniobacteraceae bacterium]